MGLGDFKSSDESQTTHESSSNKSSSSSGSSRDHPFPKYQRKAPEAVIVAEGGVFSPSGYDSIVYPDTPELTFKQSWYGKDWKLNEEPPANWKEVWWSKEALKIDCHKVQDVLGVDLRKLIREDPEAALEALREARANYESENDADEASKRQRCAVCRDLIHLYYGDYERLENKVVCDTHTMKEMSDAGVL